MIGCSFEMPKDVLLIDVVDNSLGFGDSVGELDLQIDRNPT